jgi:hypothetical protein
MYAAGSKQQQPTTMCCGRGCITACRVAGKQAGGEQAAEGQAAERQAAEEQAVGKKAKKR